MEKINKRVYVSYTIAGNGWSLTKSSFWEIKSEWDGIVLPDCILYGNKADGTREILDES